MASVNRGRMWLGGLVGGVVWVAWSALVNTLFLGPRYAEAAGSGGFLAEPRYPFFLPVHFLALIAAACVLSWLYAGVRATYGPGPRTALAVGVLAGFAMAFPLNFSVATWMPIPRIFPLWWLLETWLGAIAATLLAGLLYRD